MRLSEFFGCEIYILTKIIQCEYDVYGDSEYEYLLDYHGFLTTAEVIGCRFSEISPCDTRYWKFLPNFKKATYDDYEKSIMIVDLVELIAEKIYLNLTAKFKDTRFYFWKIPY